MVKANYIRMAAVAMAFAASVGAGSFLGSLRVSHAASISQTFSGYSFNAGCNNAIDAASMVFTQGSSSIYEIQVHAARASHGGYSYVAGLDQYFWNGSCSLAHESPATGDDFVSRWHFRYGGQIFTSDGGYASIASPHFDQRVFNPFPQHCTTTFDGARANIEYHWITDGGEHPTFYYSWWGNTYAFSKCGTLVASNGWNTYIDMNGVPYGS